MTTTATATAEPACAGGLAELSGLVAEALGLMVAVVAEARALGFNEVAIRERIGGSFWDRRWDWGPLLYEHSRALLEAALELTRDEEI
jgi:hypothetical protein